MFTKFYKANGLSSHGVGMFLSNGNDKYKIFIIYMLPGIFEIPSCAWKAQILTTVL